ncbi:MAG TPA: DNA primase small subunit domain-containing protein, partial [Candidatus Micrarchaeota archaeon]|nr:DNA primase small subunit domain-containing protein [Candidatus Micrarchaeota archaeon]
NWLGADLIFDLDAPAHDCGKFTCDDCLEKIRHQTETLANEFLIDDFGIPKNMISVNFSGNRGYHIHARDARFFDLNREARREIADYITGTGIRYEDFFYLEEALKNKRLVKTFRGPSPRAGGYHGKIGRELEKALADEKFRGTLNRKLRDAAVFANFMAGVNEGDYDRIKIAGREEKFKAIFNDFSKKLPREIDVNVTCDVSKLIRLPDSIHGGSGFAARSFPLEKIAGYMPRRDAAAFGNEPVEISVTEAVPEIDFGEHKIGPYAPGAVQKIPKTAAAYLVLKGAASFHGR